MQENAKLALARRAGGSENGKTAKAAMDVAKDCFTTCQKCRKIIAVRHVGGEWVTDHACPESP